jgi:prepilin peptidase CpaA
MVANEPLEVFVPRTLYVRFDPKNRVVRLIVPDIVIATVIGLSVFFDLTVRRIPNWLIVFGLFAGLSMNLYQGIDPLLRSTLGMLCGVAILFPVFALGWMGAGDVKCFGVMGALLGVGWLPRIFFYSALSAGSIALIYTIFGYFNLAVAKNMWVDAKLALISMGRVLPDEIGMRVSNSNRSVPWGVAFAIGTVMAYYVDYNGHWAGF